MFATEPLPGATEAADHLVGRKQDAVLVDDPLDLRPVSLRRNHQATGTLHRLADECGDPVRPHLLNLLFEFAGTLEAKLFWREVTALTEPVGLVDVHDPRQPAIRPELLVHGFHAAERCAGDGAAVITIP